MDLISGSWPGEIFFFRGGPGRTFAAPEMLKDKDGEFINIGGGVKERDDGSILITGHGEFVETPDGWVVKYQGEEYQSTPEKPVSITGTASAVHATDWDGDGDYDLLVGDIRGNVHLIPNEGTPREYQFGKEQAVEAKGRPIRVEGDAGPFAADWDGDGDLDLLVGSGDGSVSFYRNVGTAEEPELAPAKELVPPGNGSFGTDAPKEPTRGIRSKVCAADWNGDGRLDLLVGDRTTQLTDLPEPTAEEKAEQDEIREELEALQDRYRQLIPKFIGPKRTRDKDEYEKITKELKEVSGQMQELRSKLPREYETHGWVWLFLREPTESQDEQ